MKTWQKWMLLTVQSLKPGGVSKKVLCADIWSLTLCWHMESPGVWEVISSLERWLASLLHICEPKLTTHHLQASLGGLPSLQHSRENSDLDSDSSRVIPQALPFNHANSPNQTNGHNSSFQDRTMLEETRWAFCWLFPQTGRERSLLCRR